MDLMYLRECKKKLDERLHAILTDELNTFYKSTGFSVHNIRCDFVDTTTVSDPRKHYILGKVKVDLEEI